MKISRPLVCGELPFGSRLFISAGYEMVDAQGCTLAVHEDALGDDGPGFRVTVP